MQANNILNSDMLDILFEHKNKAYGAYNLRRTYDKRVYTALGLTFAVGCLFTMSTLFAGSGKKVKPIIETTVIELQALEETKKKDEPLPQLRTSPPPAAAARVIEQIRVQQHVIPDIVPDDLVPPDQTVATVEQLDKAQIGTISSLGGIDDPGMAPVVAGTGTGTGLGSHLGKGSGTEVIDEKMVIVQVEARYPGGLEAWKKFLERNLNRDMPIENGAPMARYTVVVAFTVNKEGEVSDIKAENDPGYGTAAEAVRVIKKSNKWQPAIQNGRNVTYRQRQSITFEVSEN